MSQHNYVGVRVSPNWFSAELTQAISERGTVVRVSSRMVQICCNYPEINSPTMWTAPREVCTLIHKNDTGTQEFTD